MENQNIMVMKPRGNIIFEYGRDRPIPSECVCVTLYKDGRVLRKRDFPLDNEFKHYDLLAKEKKLADEVVNFLRENERAIRKFPARMPLNFERAALIDAGWNERFKFLNKRFEYYMVEKMNEDLKDFLKKIFEIFSKYNVKIEEFKDLL